MHEKPEGSSLVSEIMCLAQCVDSMYVRIVGTSMNVGRPTGN